MFAFQFLISLAPVLIGVGGLYIAFVKWQNDREDRRSAELLREEVLSWPNECIECLQTLSVLAERRDSPLFEEIIYSKRQDLVIRISVLIERGRLFFSNDQSVEYGSGKSAAYRGYRPVILDQLVIAYQLACDWPKDEEHFAYVAKICTQNFITLIQKEVGRSRTLSPDAAKGGDSIYLLEVIRNPGKFELKK